MLKHPTTKPSNASGSEPDEGGAFITVEGIDGSGTTTVVEAIGEVYPEVLTTAEPAEQHWTGRATRRSINDDDAHPMTDFHMFIADRAYHLDNTVRPALEDGKTVVSDRYFHSTFAYQQENLAGVVDNPIAYIRYSMMEWVDIPDLTILLDLPVDVAAARRGEDEDKYEARQFQQTVAENYRDIADNTEGVVTVDADQPRNDVIDECIDILDAQLPGETQ